MVKYIMLACILSVAASEEAGQLSPSGPGETYWPAGKPCDHQLLLVKEGDKHYRLMSGIVNRFIHAKAGDIGKKIRVPLMEVRSKNLIRLFPSNKFYVFAYDEVVPPGARETGRVFGIVRCYVVDQHDKVTHFPRIHHDSPYSDFLKSEKVQITDIADANLLWKAYCDIHRRNYEHATCKKISDTQWHVGIRVVDFTAGNRTGKEKRYYDVRLDKDHKIIKCEYKREEIESTKVNDASLQ